MIIIAGIVVTYFDPETQQENALADISGVWRVDRDGTMISFQLTTSSKTVDVGGHSFAVVVDKYDNDNKVTTLKSVSNPPVVITIRQLFQDDGRYTLQMTWENGAQDQLSFVRLL